MIPQTYPLYVLASRPDAFTRARAGDWGLVIGWEPDASLSPGWGDPEWDPVVLHRDGADGSYRGPRRWPRAELRYFDQPPGSEHQGTDEPEARDASWLRGCDIAAFTVAEAAEVLRLDQRTVRRACAEGQMVSVRVGRRVLIPRASLLALLEKQGQTS